MDLSLASSPVRWCFSVSPLVWWGVDVDNAQLAQQRLILLDATLVFSMAMSVWTYIRFYRYRHQPFTTPWWRWLMATGVSLSFVMSTKYVGLFTFFTIGGAVAVDLWNLLDYRRGLPIVTPSQTAADLIERIRSPLCCSISYVDRPPFRPLSLLVLVALCDPYSFRSRRRFHVPWLPSDSFR